MRSVSGRADALMHPDDSRPRVSSDGCRPLRSTTSAVGRGWLVERTAIASLARPNPEGPPRLTLPPRAGPIRRRGCVAAACPAPDPAELRRSASQPPDRSHRPAANHRAKAADNCQVTEGVGLDVRRPHGVGSPLIGRDPPQELSGPPARGRGVARESRSTRRRWRRCLARRRRSDPPGAGAPCSRRGNRPRQVASSRAAATTRPSPGEIQWDEANSAGTSSGISPE
jgi:hypothetical protein